MGIPLEKLSLRPALSLPDERRPTDRLEVKASVGRATSADVNHPLADPSTFVEVMTYVSFDGGKTWLEAGGFSFYGGVHVRRDGTEAAESVGVAKYARGKKDRLLKTVVTTNKADLVVEPDVVAEIVDDPFIRPMDPNYREVQPNPKQFHPVRIDQRGAPL